MAIVNMPIYADLYHFRYRFDFDGDNILRIVEFHFSPRDDTAPNTDGAWSMDLYDSNGDAIVRGVKLSLGKDKLCRYRHLTGVPKACVHVVDTTGVGQEPTAKSFGATVVVQVERE